MKKNVKGRAQLHFLTATALTIACSGVGSEDGYSGAELEPAGSIHDPSVEERRSGSGPVAEAVLTDVLGQPRRFQYEAVNGLAIAEGDIVLGTLAEVEEQQKGTVRIDRLWPQRTMIYKLDSGLTATQTTRINNAISHWVSKTGLKFRERTNETAYVKFVKVDSGCSSPVGRTGGEQLVSLSTSCSEGNVIHEIGHAWGFEHEATRSNRDELLSYFPDRVLAGKEHNFTLSNQSYHRDLLTIDFGSVMMYDSYAFAKGSDGLACNEGEADCLPVLTKLDGVTTWDAQRTTLTAKDIKTAKTLYQRFDVPTVFGARIQEGQLNRNRFCQDNGYESSTSGETEQVSGSVKHATLSNGNWVLITRPGFTLSMYKSIRCAP